MVDFISEADRSNNWGLKHPSVEAYLSTIVDKGMRSLARAKLESI